MFECKDSKGVQVHIDDVCELVEESEMGLPVGAIVLVMNIISEEEVKVCPEEVGVPEVIHPEALQVNESFIQELTALSTHEELQDMIVNAEARYAERLQREKERKGNKKRASGGTRAKPAGQVVMDI